MIGIRPFRFLVDSYVGRMIFARCGRDADIGAEESRTQLGV